jgi:hypothetical protein
MRSIALPTLLIVTLVGLLTLTRPHCEDSFLKSRLTEAAFVAIFVTGAAFSAALSKNKKILRPLIVGLIAIPLSAAVWIMLIWPVWRVGFLWELYLMSLPMQVLWMIPTMLLTAWITNRVIQRFNENKNA